MSESPEQTRNVDTEAMDSAEQAGDEFAPAENVINAPAEPAARAPRAKSPEGKRPAQPAELNDATTATELDEQIAAEVETLLDMPMPFESVDEAMAAPPPSPASTTKAKPAPAESQEAEPVATEPSETDPDPVKTDHASRPSKSDQVLGEQRRKAGPANEQPELTPSESEPGADQKSPPVPIMVLVRLLMAVNFPMRLLPRSMRTAVDVFALSLLFWAPVVWVLALVVFKQ